MKLSTVAHTLRPIYNENSKTLILGTMPSPKSREAGFYYSHPQNNFWPVMAEVFGCAIPRTNTQKELFLLQNHIALWDVLQSCEIRGADDGSIKNPVVNDFSELFMAAKIKKIFTTGLTATKLYKKYCLPITLIPSVYLPSTSPANRKYYNFDALVKEYSIVKQS